MIIGGPFVGMREKLSWLLLQIHQRLLGLIVGANGETLRCQLLLQNILELPASSFNGHIIKIYSAHLLVLFRCLFDGLLEGWRSLTFLTDTLNRVFVLDWALIRWLWEALQNFEVLLHRRIQIELLVEFIHLIDSLGDEILNPEGILLHIIYECNKLYKMRLEIMPPFSAFWIWGPTADPQVLVI